MACLVVASVVCRVLSTSVETLDSFQPAVQRVYANVTMIEGGSWWEARGVRYIQY